MQTKEAITTNADNGTITLQFEISDGQRTESDSVTIPMATNKQNRLAIMAILANDTARKLEPVQGLV